MISADMIPLIASIFFIILILGPISILHFYWALGGMWGFANALPTKENGERLFTPKKIHSFIVGAGLLGIVGLLVYVFVKMINNDPTFLRDIPYTPFFLFGLGILFIFRGIGDFRYVGFFKKIKDTKFGRMDTKFFSPLCILIGLLFFLASISFPYLSGPCF